MNEIIAEDIQNILAEPLPWREFDGKTVLITGATGMMGQYFIRTFASLEKTRTLGTARDLNALKERFMDIQCNRPMLFAHNMQNPLDILERIDVCIHTASSAAWKYYKDDSADCLRTIGFSPIHLCDLLKENSAKYGHIPKYFYISTSGIYGKPQEETIDESNNGALDLRDPKTAFIQQKRAAETTALRYAKDYRLDARIARVSSCYGPSASLDLGLISSDLIADFIAKRPLTLSSDGLDKRQFIYVADAISAILTIITKGENSEIYNVAPDSAPISMLDFANALAAIDDPNRAILINRAEKTNYSKSVVKGLKLDISKIKHLGWTPKTDIGSGLLRTALSYGSH
ncbi:MAG: NAD(P)-dependent oxidoreductase [Helicobacteraceae bacterium]|jgi:dTDP-glucose 4,6-dehydratase|nr:NAD(P)-dependent oxidoreductase [Helicobacteraceae bacterium]